MPVGVLAVAGPIPLSCGHHQRDLVALLDSLGGGRLVLAGAAHGYCSFRDFQFGRGARCGCLADWLGVGPGVRRAIVERHGRVPQDVVDRVLRRAVDELRDPMDVFALLAEVHDDPVFGRRSWADAMSTLEYAGGSLAAIKSQNAPRMVLTRRARSVGQRLAQGEDASE